MNVTRNTNANVIELRNVVKRYPGTPPLEVLHGVDLTIEAGELVGIVGPSGAGKSTLFRLLQRQVEPQRGEIRIDGQRIDAVTQKSLAAAFAVVTQEVELFHRSVMENLRYGRADASQAEVLAAARAAGCDGFIRALPKGYDTLVGERGVRLSGGQRQRIAIARALLKNAPIVLLDEATSSLDSQSELEVQAGLLELTRGRTVLAIAHRLSTIMEFDRVIVLQDGEILEDGPPGELCGGPGPFGQMWRLQKRGVGAATQPEFDDAWWRAPAPERPAAKLADAD